MTQEEKSKAIEEWCETMSDDFCEWHCPLNDVISDDKLCYTLGDNTPCNIDLNYDILVKAGLIKPPDDAGESDAVHSPTHYCKGGIECIQAIKASMTADGFADYCKGNVLKYIWRWRDKGGVQDLKKAKVYLDWLIGEVSE